jgi:hypothetical protein
MMATATAEELLGMGNKDYVASLPEQVGLWVGSVCRE